MVRFFNVCLFYILLVINVMSEYNRRSRVVRRPSFDVNLNRPNWSSNLNPRGLPRPRDGRGMDVELSGELRGGWSNPKPCNSVRGLGRGRGRFKRY